MANFLSGSRIEKARLNIDMMSTDARECKQTLNKSLNYHSKTKYPKISQPNQQNVNAMDDRSVKWISSGGLSGNPS
jgi:hypothetical protein